MERNPKSAPPDNENVGKCGKFLAIGMAVALIWGIILIISGMYVRLKAGSVMQHLIGDIEQDVKVKSVVSDGGHQLIPYAETIDDDVNVGDWPLYAMMALLLCGFLTIIFGCLGIYGGLYHNNTALYITLVLLLITLITILVVLIVSSDSESSIHMDAKEALIKSLRSHYNVQAGSNSFTLTMNSIMLWFECCGITGPNNFMNLTYIEVETGAIKNMYSFKVAPACCRRELFVKDGSVLTPYMKVRDCAIKGMDLMSNINSKSCYDAVMGSISGIAMGILILILIWDIILFVLTIMTIMETVPEEEQVTSRLDSRKEELEDILPVKKFVPFARISSVTHADLNRIKSTEIW